MKTLLLITAALLCPACESLTPEDKALLLKTGADIAVKAIAARVDHSGK